LCEDVVHDGDVSVGKELLKRAREVLGRKVDQNGRLHGDSGVGHRVVNDASSIRRI
jgi:hypothetical protein